jgi:hypothetical protein
MAIIEAKKRQNPNESITFLLESLSISEARSSSWR